MTREEGAIVSAYTGVLIGKFSDFHKYVEKIMSRPVNSIEFASKHFMKEIQAKSQKDFTTIEVADR